MDTPSPSRLCTAAEAEAAPEYACHGEPQDREGFAVWRSASSNLPAVLDAKRAVRDAKRAAKAADDAYLAQSYKVLYRRRTVVVHNADEILALVELLAYAPPHYRLRWGGGSWPGPGWRRGRPPRERNEGHARG